VGLKTAASKEALPELLLQTPKSARDVRSPSPRRQSHNAAGSPKRHVRLPSPGEQTRIGALRGGRYGGLQALLGRGAPWRPGERGKRPNGSGQRIAWGVGARQRRRRPSATCHPGAWGVSARHRRRRPTPRSRRTRWAVCVGPPQALGPTLLQCAVFGPTVTADPGARGTSDARGINRLDAELTDGDHRVRGAGDGRRRPPGGAGLVGELQRDDVGPGRRRAAGGGGAVPHGPARA
jgi:hypothetical protein